MLAGHARQPFSGLRYSVTKSCAFDCDWVFASGAFYKSFLLYCSKAFSVSTYTDATLLSMSKEKNVFYFLWHFLVKPYPFRQDVSVYLGLCLGLNFTFHLASDTAVCSPSLCLCEEYTLTSSLAERLCHCLPFPVPLFSLPSADVWHIQWNRSFLQWQQRNLAFGQLPGAGLSGTIFKSWLQRPN